jgi:hypothetical protein
MHRRRRVHRQRCSSAAGFRRVCGSGRPASTLPMPSRRSEPPVGHIRAVSCSGGRPPLTSARHIRLGPHQNFVPETSGAQVLLKARKPNRSRQSVASTAMNKDNAKQRQFLNHWFIAGDRRACEAKPFNRIGTFRPQAFVCIRTAHSSSSHRGQHSRGHAMGTQMHLTH